MARGNLALARQYLSPLDWQSNKYPEAIALLSTVYLQQNRFEDCLSAARDLRSSFPDSSTPFSLAAFALAERGEPVRALGAAVKAVTLAPGSAFARAALARAAQANGMSDVAIRQARVAISLDPALADGYLPLAGALKAKGQLEAAEVAANKAIALKPFEGRGYRERADIRRLYGNSAGALADERKLSDLGFSR